VKRLNWVPLFLGAGTILVAVGAMLWALISANDPGDAPLQAQAAPTDGGLAPAASEVLSRAPHGPYIPATLSAGPPVSQRRPLSPVLPERTQAPVPAGPAIYAPGMSPVEVEARKAAWQHYFEARQHVADQQQAALVAAYGADTSTAGSSGSKGADSDSTSAEASGASGSQFQEKTGKHAFLDQAGATAETDYLPATVTDPISRYELKAADIIEGKMIGGLTTESHGIVKAVVTKNVLDHATGMHILIPQGATLVGIYDTGTAYGQKRVEVGWERIIFPPPCDQSLDIGLMPGSDQSGFSGFHDITETHFWEIAQNLALASVFSAGIQLSQPQGNSYGGYNSQQIVAGALGQQLGEFGMEMARKGMDIPPTEKVRNGYPFTVMVTKDIAFSHPWQDGACGGAMEASIGN
jgi:type IV secretory pathway VirB10-like protein